MANDGKDREQAPPKGTPPLVGVSQFLSVNPNAVVTTLNGNPVQVAKQVDKDTGVEMIVVLGKRPLVVGNARAGLMIRNDRFLMEKTDAMKNRQAPKPKEQGGDAKENVDADTEGGETGKKS